MELTLSSSVQYVPRVGPMMAKRLEKLGIRTVEDLLYHIPFRYDDFSLISPINRVQTGEVVTVEGTITKISFTLTKTGKKLVEATISDDTGSLPVIWFNQPFLARVLPVGTQVRLAGKIDWFGHKVVITSPSYEMVESQPQGPALSVSLHTGRLVPIYSETEGVSSKWLRGRVAYALELFKGTLTDFLPPPLLQTHSLINLEKALATVHFPNSFDEAKTAKRRLSFDELFLLQLTGLEKRRFWEDQNKSVTMNIDTDDISACIATLPFTLTADQKKAVDAILSDITRSVPMNRLLEGDVGSGKTVVSAVAMYCVCKNGFQSLFMAPTEILAFQHYETISRFLSPLGIRVGIYTGSKKSELQINDILVGTHALIEKKLDHTNVGLIVIDEQHRFGVSQRATLLTHNKKTKTPHLLTMTATPIPRTIARTMFGNLDLSIIGTLPTGRQKVKTWVVPNEKRTRAYEWTTKEIQKTSSQAFIVCPLIDESETLTTVKAVKTEYARLAKIFPSFRLGLLHGRMKAVEKESVLNRFRKNDIHILITTPVVEVGIDIPNATIMIIEAAERFGLGQLHQLRGRVGRGILPSYCFLFTENDAELTVKRLKALETIYSGPELAEVDLTMRGPGELFGRRQHGIPILHIASFSDSQLLEETHRAARIFFTQDSNLNRFPLLREKLKKDTMKGTIQD
ncbi:ATP-dependent DNA helicase RecG [Candidatus Gottesmanbacteria bacterium]|nr:ATP-dependent DNA helicase RecG [Candidatus Gottesmanbacteria bacterium]